MSIHPISIAIISGQKYAGEVATLASAFLDMSYLSITPVSINSSVGEDFSLPLEIYRLRDYSIHYQWGYEKKLTLPNNNLFDNALFWLAIDKEGYTIASDIVAENGSSPNEKVYKSVSKVNLLTPQVPPYPEIVSSPKFWGKIKSALYQVEQNNKGVKSQEGRKKILEKHVPITPVEKAYFTWYNLFRESLTPWNIIIKSIISDWS